MSLVYSLVMISFLCLCSIISTSASRRLIGVVNQEVVLQNIKFQDPLKNVEKVVMKVDNAINIIPSSKVNATKLSDEHEIKSMQNSKTKNIVKHGRSRASSRTNRKNLKIFGKKSNVSKANVSWRVPRTKIEVTQIGYLDYAPPKVHPPSHN